ncbi:MAG: aldehyde dehydrogenase [Oscillospiraceae bacterium]|nr:aldehyde dehydrogenase [Oscillospiraceae bacterium]
MTKDQITEIVAKQRAFFQTGATLDVEFRIDALKKLRRVVADNEAAIAEAMGQDLGKSAVESYMCETGMVLSEISYMLRHVRGFAREKTVPTPIVQFASRSYQKPTPYGVTLIMSPWNYPLLLTLDPLADAIAAGNTAVIKPSAYSPATSELMKKLIESVFPAEYVAVVTGGREENASLLEEKFDNIFFTGSKTVGRMVLEKAAVHLTSTTLELGGKSPCIVDRSADLKLAARRIVFGKFLNCGQTCVAPDYILCHHSVKERFVECLKAEIRRQYGSDYLRNPTYGKMISGKHFRRVAGLIDPEKTVIGGGSDEAALKIEPTVMDRVTWDDPVMGEEIFGPVLPILTFDSIEEVIGVVNSHDKPLALYIYAGDKAVIKAVTSRCAYGGGCVNDCIIHLATSQMGFGGVGESGMGAYHGKTGFDAFTHYKSIVDKKTWLDLPMRYQPYKKLYDKLIHLFLK